LKLPPDNLDAAQQQVRLDNPLKQGLKLFARGGRLCEELVRLDNPLKQGLKP